KPVLMGPHTENFRESAALLEAAGAAVVVRDAGELGRELARLLSDAGLRAKLGDAAYEAAASHRGAVREALELVSRLLVPGDHLRVPARGRQSRLRPPDGWCPGRRRRGVDPARRRGGGRRAVPPGAAPARRTGGRRLEALRLGAPRGSAIRRHRGRSRRRVPAPHAQEGPRDRDGARAKPVAQRRPPAGGAAAGAAGGAAPGAPG